MVFRGVYTHSRAIAAKLDKGSPELDKTLQPILQVAFKLLWIALVLKTGQKVIGKPKIVRFAATCLLTGAEAKSDVMQVDVREQRRYNGSLGRAFFRARRRAPSIMTLLSIRMISRMTRSSPMRCGETGPSTRDDPVKKLLTSASSTWLTLSAGSYARVPKTLVLMRSGRYPWLLCSNTAS